MKKLLLILALGLTAGLHATTALTAQNSQLLQHRNDTTTREIFQGVFLTDSSGTPIGLSVTVSGGIPQSLSLTGQTTRANVGMVSETFTASLLSGYLSVSETGRSVNSGGIALALTSLAGSATGVFWAEFSTLGGPSCTGVYYDVHQNATAPLYYHYLAASATAIVFDNQAAGQHLNLLAPAGATCTCKVNVGKKTPQAP